MDNLKFTTRAIHTPYLRDDPAGALHMPVYDTVAYEFNTSEDIELAFIGKKPDHMYSRISNPTVEHFEQKIKNITDAFAVMAFSSGMAAISNLVLALIVSGDNFITSRHLFGNTYSLFTNTLKPFGIEPGFVDIGNYREVEQGIDEKTRFIFLESITNPQLEVADIGRIAEITRKNNIPLIVDSTLTPPFLFKASDFGVDLEVISSTKFISGGATSVGGLIIDYGTYEWEYNEKLTGLAQQFGSHALMVKLRREIFRNLGACLSPHNAYLQSLGLETVALRTTRACLNCLDVANFLITRPEVSHVNYPGLGNSKYYQICKKQFRYPGSILTFSLASKEACFSFMDKLKIIRRATNLNDNKTLILHPASTIFSEYSPEELKVLNVPDTMIRLSVGIEDVEDLVEDIKQAFVNI